MPWTPTQFASRHNHSLHGERAEHASRIANAVLRRGVPEGESIAIANKYAKNHRADGGYTMPTQSPARERAAEVLSRGRGQSRETDLNLTPTPAYGAWGGDIPTRPHPDWLPQPMGPDSTRVQPPMISNRTARGGRLAAGGPAPTAPTYQTGNSNTQGVLGINSQGYANVNQPGTINLDLTNGALTPASNAQLQGLAQRGIPIQGPPPPPSAAPPTGSPGIPGIFGPTGSFAAGSPSMTDAQSQAWNQQWGGGGSGGGTATGGRIPRRANGGLSPSMEFPSWSRMQARGEDDTHPSGLIPGAGGGRQDNVAMNLAPHSHVIPADVVSGWGGGNTVAGAANLEHAMHSGPFGTSLPKVPMHAPRMAAPRMPRMARGGNAKGVRTLVSSGEYIVPPDDVHRLGGGDIDEGHNRLDEFIVRCRKQIIAHQRRLPGPVKE